MAGVIESFKRFYSKENSSKNVIMFLFVVVFSVLSSATDVFIGTPDTMRQNIFDGILSLLVGVYSLQFLHQALKTLSIAMLPPFNSISKKALGGMIALNIVWSIYAIVVIIAGAAWFVAVKDIIFPVMLAIALCLIVVFTTFVFIRFSENFELKGLFDIRLPFRFIKASFAPVMIQVLKFIPVMLIVVLFYMGIYVIGDLFKLTEIYPIAKDTYLLDLIMMPTLSYVFIVILFFVFPYSLVEVYIQKIRPLFPDTVMPEQIAEQEI